MAALNTDFDRGESSFWSSLSQVTRKHSKTSGRQFEYGTAGFRAEANQLDFVMFRMGLLAALRSKATRAVVGVMITASHNPEEDNGVKLIDPMGDMLEAAWEILATHLVNVEDGDLVRTLEHIIRPTNVDMKENAIVYIGRDTRRSSLSLSSAVSDGVKCLGGLVKDFGLLTTPQLHFIVYCTNTSSKYGSPTEQGYYHKLASAFKSFRNLINGNYVSSTVRLDCANGVGADKMKQMLSFLNESISVELYNTGEGKLNHQCGADFVKIQQKPPEDFPLEAGVRCASFDGDGDRVVYFYLDSGGEFHLFDGDKIAALVAAYLRQLLYQCKLDATIGVVQTAYANGNSTQYLTNVLGLPVACVSTGVKHLHNRATRFDVGIYFESNGHGTVVFSEEFERKLNDSCSNDSLPAAQMESQRKLRSLIDVINQTVGDAISDLLLVECILMARNWTVEEWDAIYRDLPSKQIKLSVMDRNAITTTDAERKVVEPSGLQNAIDSLVCKYDKGRAFVRPSGTENIVRVYAEAETQVAANKLAHSVALAVYNLAGGIGNKPEL